MTQLTSGSTTPDPRFLWLNYSPLRLSHIRYAALNKIPRYPGRDSNNRACREFCVIECE
jgi:hypothetical protein